MNARAMALGTLLFLSLAAAPRDPVAEALESFRSLSTYSVTLRSGSGKAEEVIRYFYKKPGYVRMEFITPHSGALLVYNPLSKTVRLRPFGFAKAFTLTLSPQNRLVRSARGHTADASTSAPSSRGCGPSRPTAQPPSGARKTWAADRPNWWRSKENRGPSVTACTATVSGWMRPPGFRSRPWPTGRRESWWTKRAWTAWK